MMTFARVQPNKLGQPQRVTFGIQALDALGIEMPHACHAELSEAGVLTITPNPDGSKMIRSLNGAGSRRGGMAPYVALPELLCAANEQHVLDRAPRHAEVIGGILCIHLHQVIIEEEYRWRRWQSYTRADVPMSPERALHLGAARTENVTISLSPVLLAELQAEAQALKLTVPAYIAQVLGSVDRQAIAAPVAEDFRQAGHLVRMARKEGQALSAEEMIARGIPPASDEAWLRARVEEGLTYAEMAEQWGGSSSVYSKWGRAYGIKRDRHQMMRRVWQGRGRK